MPVEIRKLIIKGKVYESSTIQSSSKTYSTKPNKKEIEKEQIKLHRFRRQILSECKEMIQTQLERNSKRY